MSIIRNLIHKKTDGKSPVALCLFYDGRFDSELANAGIKLVGVKQLSVYNWCENFRTSNVELIEQHEIGNHTYDFIICNDLIAQREHVLQFSRSLHLPVLVVMHEQFQETPYHLQQRLQELKANIVYAEYGREGISYGTYELPNVEKDIEILIEGNFEQCDFPLLHSLKKELPGLVVIGKNPGLDFNVEPLFYEEYREYFARCKMFINLPTQRNISYQLLWAMSNGAIPISLKTPHIIKLFEETAGLLASNPNEIVVLAKQYSNKDSTIGEQAKRVNDLFKIDDFNNKWQEVTKQYSKKVFVV